MPRYKAILEYDGTPFVGWQRQKNGLAVQEVFERALTGLFKENISITGAGRTDSGVHALGQVTHFDAPDKIEPFRMREALNYYLKPHPVAIKDLATVSDEFNARFDAVSRLYRYDILNRAAPPTLQAGRVWHIGRPIDLEVLEESAGYFLGTHDFTTFRAVDCQAKSPIRTIDSVKIEKSDDLISIYVRAKSFLHRQVRAMVGSLAKVGTGKRPPDYIRDILAAKDRKACGPSAPPYGLYFAEVRYKDDV